jgi:hypothetical protein
MQFYFIALFFFYPKPCHFLKYNVAIHRKNENARFIFLFLLHFGVAKGAG